MKAIKNDIVVYAAHTNLDNAPGGVNFKIAEKIGLKNVRILEAKENALVKLTTFVPTAQAEDVRKALFDAGCGNIGNYDLCSYNMEGEGTFRAREGATPYCGAIGELHTEREVRIETIIPAYKKRQLSRHCLRHIHMKNRSMIFIPCKTHGYKPEPVSLANWKYRRQNLNS